MIKSENLKTTNGRSYFPELQYLRVLAITCVFIYHFTSRRAELLPYGNYVNGAPWNLGWQGVYLFFMISGFVIAASLEKSNSALGFIKKRFFRIYPALFIILPLIYLCQKYIPNSEFKSRSTIPNLMTSISLLPPTFINATLDLHVDWVTLVLWSLKVETCFYFIMFFLRIFLPTKSVLDFIPKIGIFSGLFLVLSPELVNYVTPLGSAFIFMKWISLDFLNWFILGILLRKWVIGEGRASDLFIFLINLALALRLLSYHELNILVVSSFLFLILIMVATLKIGKNRNYFSNSLILKAGNSSYEMYLIHQGIGFTIFYFVVKTQNLGSLGASLIACGIFIICFVISYLFWKYINLNIEIALKKLFNT